MSLQYKDDAAEVAAFEEKTGCKVLRLPWVRRARGLKQDTDLYAAFIAELDEVVGVHTTSLHLRRRLGVPTTTLTHRGSGWRYAPDEMLWYPPTTRLWKKDRGESWRECIGALVRHRRELAAEARHEGRLLRAARAAHGVLPAAGGPAGADAGLRL